MEIFVSPQLAFTLALLGHDGNGQLSRFVYIQPKEGQCPQWDSAPVDRTTLFDNNGKPVYELIIPAWTLREVLILNAMQGAILDYIEKNRDGSSFLVYGLTGIPVSAAL